MGAKTDYLAQKTLDHNTSKAAYTMPAAQYLGYHSGDPGDTGKLLEETDSAYARQAITWNASTVSGNDSSITNNGAITFPQATEDQGTISHVTTWDALTSGNALYMVALTNSKAIGINDQLIIPDTQLTLTET